MSLDGKIATAGRESFVLGSRADIENMLSLRKRAHAIIMGGSTIRTYRKYCGLKDREARQPANVVLSSRLESIDPSWPFFERPGVRRILFVTGRVPPARRAQFERTSEIIEVRKDRELAPQMIRELGKRGLHRLAVEGGGGVMWEFAKLNLIDEYRVTLTPRILGGTEAPTLVDGKGFNPADSLSLRLKSYVRKGDELYLTYLKR